MDPQTRLSIAALLSGALLLPPSGGHTTGADGGAAGHATHPYSASSTVAR